MLLVVKILVARRFWIVKQFLVVVTPRYKIVQHLDDDGAAVEPRIDKVTRGGGPLVLVLVNKCGAVVQPAALDGLALAQD